MLFDTRSRPAHRNLRDLFQGFIRLTASYKHNRASQVFSTLESRMWIQNASGLNTRKMNLNKPSFAAIIALITGFVPAQSSAEEPLLELPIAFLEPSDTLNPYLSPMTEYGSGHRGIDLPADIGTEVLSPATGIISFIGKVGYRNLISVEFGNSLTASLEPVCSEVSEGTAVTVGELIGVVCEPDPEYVWHCSSICLHFGTRTEEGYFSPLALIGGLGPSRLVY